MEVPLKSALINYFVQLETTDLKWKEYCENLKRPIEGLKNQSEQYCHVISKDVDNAELCHFDDLREKLIFKISVGIEDEVTLILKEMRHVKNYIEDLKIKLNRLEKARSDASLKETSFKKLVDGTSYVPRLDLLMEWSIESYTYYSQLHQDAFLNFKTLDYKNFGKVEKWVKSMNRHKRDQDRIKYILCFTQFLIKDSVK